MFGMHKAGTEVWLTTNQHGISAFEQVQVVMSNLAGPCVIQWGIFCCVAAHWFSLSGI
jgi:hypothetical protein